MSAEKKIPLDALMKRQELAWSFAKEMRDSLETMLRTAEHTLEKMEALGMDKHLPTVTEMFGLFDKTPKQLKAMDDAAANRVFKAATKRRLGEGN